MCHQSTKFSDHNPPHTFERQGLSMRNLKPFQGHSKNKKPVPYAAIDIPPKNKIKQEFCPVTVVQLKCQICYG